MSTSTLPIKPYSLSQATQVQLSLDYIFDAVDCTVIVNFLDSNGNQLAVTSVYIPPDTYASWQADTVITDYVFAALNLTPA